MEPEYIKINRELWDKRTEAHLKTEFYNVPAFLNGNSTLNKTELDLLGDITGKSLLHLQCHFGLDTMSLARLGAEVTGVDLSPKAIQEAEKLAEQTQLQAKFVCSDIYDLPNNLQGKYDIIYTTYGTIGWLPDMTKWANIIAHFLKPSGLFILVDFHPVVWMFDDEFKYIQYSYFNKETIIEEESGSYADHNADIKNLSYGWNHDLSEVLNALIQAGLKIEVFNEYDFSHYNCFKHTEKTADGNYVIKHLRNKIPMMYGVRAGAPLSPAAAGLSAGDTPIAVGLQFCET